MNFNQTLRIRMTYCAVYRGHQLPVEGDHLVDTSLFHFFMYHLESLS